MHVVDATLFYSPTSGGVKRYLLAKHEWMRAHTNWRHSLLVPGEARTHVPGDISTIAGSLVPGAFNYRLPLNPVHWSRAIDALEPDLIEVGDAFHPAWAAANVAGRRGIPLIAFYHSNFPQLAGRRLGRAVQKFIEWYVRLTYEQCEPGARAEPLHVRIPAQHWRRARHLSASRSGRRHLQSRAPHPRSRRRTQSAARHSRAGFRRTILRREEHSGADGGVPAARRLLSPVVDRRRRRWPRRQRHAHPLLPRQSRARQLLRVGRCIRARRHARNLRAGGARGDGLRPAGGGHARRSDAGARRSKMLAYWRSRTRMPMPPPRISPARLSGLYERDLDALGAAARRHVVSNYSWSRALQSLMARYQSALASRIPAGLPGLARAGTTQ